MLSKASCPTLIAEGTQAQGDLIFSCETQICGVVEGDVKLETMESLQIGRTGWIQGDIEAEGPVIVDGRIFGKIASRSKITVTSSGFVRGILQAPRIEICPGASIEGEIYTNCRQSEVSLDAKALAA